MAKPDPDLEKLKKAYESNTRSLRDLAPQFGVSHTQIGLLAKKHGWTRARKRKARKPKATKSAAGPTKSSSRQPKVQKRGRGRPCMKDQIPEFQLEFLYRIGCIDAQVCEFFAIDEDTLNNWKKKYPEFFSAIKDWKKDADGKVVKSLFESACGYKHEEDKIFNDNGKPLIVPTIKHYPPDYRSMSLWLRNRLPAEWRDKTDIDITDACLVQTILESLPAEIQAQVKAEIKERLKKSKGKGD